jgi:hypothetical protein
MSALIPEHGGGPEHEPASPYAYICNLIERIAALEAQNRQLRAALQVLADLDDGDNIFAWGCEDEFNQARAALAATEPK